MVSAVDSEDGFLISYFKDFESCLLPRPDRIIWQNGKVFQPVLRVSKTIQHYALNLFKLFFYIPLLSNLGIFF